MRLRTSTRVRYPETDRMGVAHHTHYLVWFELGRTELMRDIGCAYGDLEEQGVFFPVVEVGARFHRPARYDDLLEIETRIARLRGARVRFEYSIYRAADGILLATGFSEHAATGRSGRPLRLPDSLRRRLDLAAGGTG